VASASARASAAQGRVSLGAVPRAQVVIDGRYIRYTPLHDHALPAGEHQVLLQTDDSRKKAFSIVVPEEGSVTRVWYFEEKRWAGE
jgi:hypothetical protein